MEHRLFNEAQALPAVSPAAALAYRDNTEKLRLQVDKEMAAFTDILPLIGFSPVEMMQVTIVIMCSSWLRCFASAPIACCPRW